MGATIYLVRPDFADSREVVHQYQQASRWIDVARELASLAGDEERGRKIKMVWLRMYLREPPMLHIEDIDEMLSLLDGLELTLIGRVVDEKWRVTPAQLPDLRARMKTLEMGEHRGLAELHAVGEGMYGIVALRKIFTIAKDEGLLVTV